MIQRQVSIATMAGSILLQIGTWLADHTLDELIEKTSGPDITLGELRILHSIEKKDKADSELDELIEKPEVLSKLGILYFIEKRDKADSERMMWGLLRTYNQIFMEANVLLYFKRISGVIFMGGVIDNHGGFPNLHKFWEMIVGKKIFSSQLSLKIPPEVHPEARALLRTQMILLIEYAGFGRKEALDMIDKNWREELRMEINYDYGHYWETPCCVLDPRKVSLDMLCRNGRIWDAAEDKWYARVRQIYKEEILDKAPNKVVDPTPKGLTCNNPPIEYEPASIDANGDWFNEDAERSAQELWKILESKNAWPGWDEARKYWNLKPRDLSIKIPLIPKK